MEEFEHKLEEIRNLPTCEPCDGEECEFHALCKWLRPAETPSEAQ